jgi:hypothetical protein
MGPTGGGDPHEGGYPDEWMALGTWVDATATLLSILTIILGTTKNGPEPRVRPRTFVQRLVPAVCRPSGVIGLRPRPRVDTGFGVRHSGEPYTIQPDGSARRLPADRSGMQRGGDYGSRYAHLN